MLRDKFFISLCLGASLITVQSWGMERENDERKNSGPKLYLSVDLSLYSPEPLVIFTDRILQDGSDCDEGLVECEQVVLDREQPKDSKRAQAKLRLVTELGEIEKVRKWLKEIPFPEGIKNLIAGYVAAFPTGNKFSGYLQLGGPSSNLHQEVYETPGDWARSKELLLDDKGRLVVQTKQGLKHIRVTERRYRNLGEGEAEIQKRNRKERLEIEKVLVYKRGKLERSAGRNAGNPKVNGFILARLVKDSKGTTHLDIEMDSSFSLESRPFSGWVFRLKGEPEDIDSTDEMSLE